jgi:hypothetical protein
VHHIQRTILRLARRSHTPCEYWNAEFEHIQIPRSYPSQYVRPSNAHKCLKLYTILHIDDIVWLRLLFRALHGAILHFPRNQPKTAAAHQKRGPHCMLRFSTSLFPPDARLASSPPARCGILGSNNSVYTREKCTIKQCCQTINMLPSAARLM